MLKEFKIIYGETPATREQLDAIEEIVVEQEIGRAWQARIKIPVCIADDGSWGGENDAAYAATARVRIEARIGDESPFVPLIDGRIMTRDPGMSSEPGASTLTLTVEDDTTLLHRAPTSEGFAGMSASDIANSIYSTSNLGGNVEVEETGAPPNPNAVVQQNGTAMQILRSLMRRHPDFYAYVLPGSETGKSDCFFKRLPLVADPALPALFLTGANRNISGFNIQHNSNGAATYEGDSLDLDDLSARSGSSASSDVPPPAGEPATLVDPANSRVRRLPPGSSDLADMSETAAGAADSASYTIRAEGSVLPQCYPAILSPYKRIGVRVSNSRYSTDYVIFKVTHTLGRSEYTQSFSVRGNAATPEASSGGPASSALAAAGAASVGFNIQLDIF